MNYPKNHGKKWTAWEKEMLKSWWTRTTLICEFDEREAIMTIAEEFGRTPYSIAYQLHNLGHVDNPGRYCTIPYTCDNETKEKIRSGGWEAKDLMPDHMEKTEALATMYGASSQTVERLLGKKFDEVIIDEYEEIFMTKVYEEQVLVFGVNVARAVEEQLLELLTSIDSKREALIDINPGNTRYFEKVLGELENAEMAVLAQLDERFS